MPFRFPLDAVLKYRENIERREYLALGRIHQLVAEAEIMLQQCEDVCAAAAYNRETQTARGLASVHLQDAYQQEHALHAQRDQLRARLQELRIKLAECRKSYDIARQKREILDELRTQRWDAYLREQTRREQRQIDDLFLSRRKRGS